jgi:hypothetical protein
MGGRVGEGGWMKSEPMEKTEGHRGEGSQDTVVLRGLRQSVQVSRDTRPALSAPAGF